MVTIGNNVIAADSFEECNSKLQKVANELALWFDMVGLTMNIKKSEVIGFGFDPNPILINGETIYPSKSIKFLGLTIQQNLKWSLHVDNLCNKLRASAGRIRLEGRHFSLNDRKKLFFAWTQGTLLSNALAFLPRLNDIEISRLQTASNSALRAVLGLPRYGKIDLTHFRKSLKIPSICNLRERLLSEAAWKTFQGNIQPNASGPVTRSQANLNLIHPVQKGHHGQMIRTKIVASWNSLPTSIKTESKLIKARDLIKKFVYDFYISFSVP